jgi:hypothetical protein
MFQYLQKLPKNENDAFAAFFLKQIDARKDKAPDLSKPKDPAPAPAAAPAPQTQPQPEASKATAPEGSRQGEEPAKAKPAPSRALAE